MQESLAPTGKKGPALLTLIYFVPNLGKNAVCEEQPRHGSCQRSLGLYRRWSNTHNERAKINQWWPAVLVDHRQSWKDDIDSISQSLHNSATGKLWKLQEHNQILGAHLRTPNDWARNASMTWHWRRLAKNSKNPSSQETAIRVKTISGHRTWRM